MAIASWVIYDIGNTLFFVGVVGLYFPLWVTEELGGNDATVGYTLAGAMAVNLLLAPVVGALSDQLKRRVPLLALSTLVCAGATAFLGRGDLAVALVLFGLAMIAIYVADIIYNTLLSEVSTEETSGRVAGLGVGTGYIGAIVAVVIGLTLVESVGYAYAFRTVSIIIVVASVPLVVFLRERPRSESERSTGERVRMTLVQLRTSLADLPRSPGLLRFLAARFWYSWSLYTASVFAVLFATDTVGLSTRQVQLVLLVGLLVAIPGGLTWGMVVDRLGPGPTMKALLLMWMLTLLLAFAIPMLGFPAHLWWLVGVLSGILVSGIWTADRPYLLRLASSSYVGEVFGLRSVTSRLAAIVGPFVWGYISVTLGFGQPAALLSLVVCVAISLVLIAGVRHK